MNDKGTTYFENSRRATLAQRAYVMENGRIVLSGAAAALRDDPALRRAYLGM